MARLNAVHLIDFVSCLIAAIVPTQGTKSIWKASRPRAADKSDHRRQHGIDVPIKNGQGRNRILLGREAGEYGDEYLPWQAEKPAHRLEPMAQNAEVTRCDGPGGKIGECPYDEGGDEDDRPAFLRKPRIFCQT